MQGQGRICYTCQRKPRHSHTHIQSSHLRKPWQVQLKEEMRLTTFS